MSIDPAIRIELLHVALLCSGLYAAYRVLLTVLYPLLAGALWQHILGPVIEARWCGAAQCEDKERPSYMPLADGRPYVVAWGLLPPPVDDVTHGIRDGLPLGVLVALLPEVMSTGMLTLLLTFVIVKAAWQISRKRGSVRTDQVFWSVREVLMCVGAIASLDATGLFK